MSERQRITKTTVERLKPGQTVWDTEVRGFLVRKQRRDAVYTLRCSVRGRLHILTIGPHGAPWTVDTARDKARELRGELAAGADLSGARRRLKSAPTVREFADSYLKQVSRVHKKATTAKMDETMINRHIVPALGDRRVADLDRADVSRFHAGMQSRPVAANRALALLSHMLNYAIEKGERSEGSNPCKRVKKYAETSRERFLTLDELARLGAAIAEAETVGIPWEPDPKRKTKHATKPENRKPAKIDAYTAGALRLLLFTGARLREVLHLKWSNVDTERGLLFLDDSKTGRKTIVLNAPALAVLSELKRVGPYVFPGDAASTPKKWRKDPTTPALLKPRNNLKHAWQTIRRRADLEGVRLHDLRHTFASVGAGAGLGLPIVGKLLGHSQASTTARYAHLEADPVRRASNAIAGQIAAALAGKAAVRMLPAPTAAEF